MKTSLSRWPIAGALLLLGTFVGKGVLADASPPVPFRGSFTYTESFAQSTACPGPAPNLPGLQGTSTGSGTASHLGNTSFKSTLCAAPLPNGTIRILFAHLTAEAANGDLLYASYRGLLSPTGTPDTYTFSGSLQVDGGTGRFADASGEGYLSGSLERSASTAQGTFVLEGRISY